MNRISTILSLVLVSSTVFASDYIQVVTCKTLKGPEVGLFQSAKAYKILTQNGWKKGIVGSTVSGEDLDQTSFSIDFGDDDNTHPMLMSKSWPFSGVVPVLIASKEIDGGFPERTKIINASYQFNGPVELLKVNGENQVKSAKFSVQGKLMTYVTSATSLNDKMQDALNREASAASLESAKKDISAELDKYAAGLVDTELACELSGIVK
jgi:hypothetical protein